MALAAVAERNRFQQRGRAEPVHVIDLHARVDQRAHRVAVATLGRPFERATVGGGTRELHQHKRADDRHPFEKPPVPPCKSARTAAPDPAKPRLPAVSGHVKSRRTHLKMKCSNPQKCRNE
ncbi:hypothetical protein [Burkholderia sp. Bp8991]|uniref:hypothetical protein n=1 Tax=Burkholderia sp. Bp8991 TaxID=2184553 RepID=UPI00163A1342